MRKAPIIIMVLLTGLVGCSKELPQDGGSSRVGISLLAPDFLEQSKSTSPDESLLSDLNLFIFNSKGELEDSRFVEGLNAADGRYSYEIDLLRNNKYSLYACANLGYKLGCKSREEVEAFRYYLSRTDDYALGCPMTAILEDFSIGSEDGQRLTIPLERAVARIRVRLDRSLLDKDIDFTVSSVRIYGCPKSVSLFTDSKAEAEDDLFSGSFYKSDYDADALNSENAVSGLSGTVDLYMLENLQGTELSSLCSYVEMRAQYLSDTHYTLPGEEIAYRFYLGDRRRDYNVERNCSYTVTIIPKGDGLGDAIEDDGRGSVDWRIDKENLLAYVESVSLDASSLSFTYAGESRSLSATVLPSDAGSDLLEWSSSDSTVAEVDSEGTVTATGDGQCVITCCATDGSGCSAACAVTVAIQPAWVEFHNVGYQESRVGESMTIWADYFPPNMKCEADQECLDFDVERGIYDYELSEDKSSVTLYFRNPGSGLFIFEVGEPLDTSTMVYLHIYPEDWVSTSQSGTSGETSAEKTRAAPG